MAHSAFQGPRDAPIRSPRAAAHWRKHEARRLPITVTLGDETFSGQIPVTYKAKQGDSGTLSSTR